MRRILLSIIIILLLSGMTGMVYAWPDNGHYCNHYHHRCLDLKLKDQDENWSDGVTETWTVNNMAPGDELYFNDSFVGLKSDKQGTVDVTCAYEVYEESPQAEVDSDPYTDLHSDEMGKQMVITRCIYKNKYWQIDCLTGEFNIILGCKLYSLGSYINDNWIIKDANSDGKITFYDLKQNSIIKLPLQCCGCTDGTRFEMDIKFHEDSGNEFQGDTFNLTMVYTLKQK